MMAYLVTLLSWAYQWAANKLLRYTSEFTIALLVMVYKGFGQRENLISLNIPLILIQEYLDSIMFFS